ncbi:MAG: hypothetical protein GY820_36215 [Gammaproteobacteria bacterium]|nr:hypothetical protein [Gammaproteobacteria bacterium]
MNMVLADMQSLHPNAGGVVADAGSINSESGESQFPYILASQLYRHVELPPQVEYPQVVDLKPLLSSDSQPGETLEPVPEIVEVPSVWLQQPTADAVVETKTLEQGSPAILKPVEAPGDELVGSHSPVIGHALPVGGNALPPEPGSVNKSLPVTTNISAVDPKPTAVQLPISMKEAVNIDAHKKDNIKLSELRVTDHAMLLRTVDSGLPSKPQFQSEIFNTRSGEVQSTQSNLIEIAELNKGQNRLQSPATELQSITTQRNPTMLPTSLETLSVSSGRDTATWGNGIGERVHWMINQKLNTATIRLDPPMLGRLEVNIQVNDDITNVIINTQHAQTRDLIDNASFRLRDYLQENGYQNVNVDVSHQQEQQASQQTHDDSDHHLVEAGLAQGAEVDDESQLVEFVSSDSVIDYFV